MSWTQQEVRELKEGRYMLIDEEPCKIINIATSKPGKHGEAKANIDAVGIFDGRKRNVVYPVKHRVQVPMIDKRKAQILSISGEEVQLMDLDNYETFQLPIPEEYKGQLTAGEDIMYMIAMDRRKITKV
ncbi:MAG TPA: translation initiation factor IF-5A [Methanomassiliicoccales archaeon]|nr:translation initiation factor IF-5A [Methanomassiliicoccales archaeon]HNX47275.1 translation initiation factor IF-5A [Methanomassiliicoccales archaeon]HSA36009.1 translation initiation factor IF-5A [Methanomassiliicoccales archaeon]